MTSPIPNYLSTRPLRNLSLLAPWAAVSHFPSRFSWINPGYAKADSLTGLARAAAVELCEAISSKFPADDSQAKSPYAKSWTVLGYASALGVGASMVTAAWFLKTPHKNIWKISQTIQAVAFTFLNISCFAFSKADPKFFENDPFLKFCYSPSKASGLCAELLAGYLLEQNNIPAFYNPLQSGDPSPFRAALKHCVASYLVERLANKVLNHIFILLSALSRSAPQLEKPA